MALKPIWPLLLLLVAVLAPSPAAAQCEGDVTLPTIACPDDLVVSLEPDAASGPVAYPIPEAADNCGTPTAERVSGFVSGSAQPVGGPYTVTYRARDTQDNVSPTCSFAVTVVESREAVSPDSASDDFFGKAVAVSADGRTMIVGASAADLPGVAGTDHGRAAAGLESQPRCHFT